MAVKDDVIKSIEGMNVLELADLVKELQDKFGVSGQMAQVAVGAPAAQRLLPRLLKKRALFPWCSSHPERIRFRLLKKCALSLT